MSIQNGNIDGVLLVCKLHPIYRHGKRIELCTFMYKPPRLRNQIHFKIKTLRSVLVEAL